MAESWQPVDERPALATARFSDLPIEYWWTSDTAVAASEAAASLAAVRAAAVVGPVGRLLIVAAVASSLFLAEGLVVEALRG